MRQADMELKASVVGEIEIVGPQPLTAPAPMATAGPEAERAFWEYFVATIRNHNTRRAYQRAAVSTPYRTVPTPEA